MAVQNPNTVRLDSSLVSYSFTNEALMFTYLPNGDDQHIIIAGVATAFSAFPAGTTDVLVTTVSGTATYTIDGSTPTATAGQIIPADQERVWPIEMVTAMKMIRSTASSAEWHASPLKKS
jgi:hypothetical protein